MLSGKWQQLCIKFNKHVTPSTLLCLVLYCVTTTCFGPSGTSSGGIMLGSPELCSMLVLNVNVEIMLN